MRTFKGTGVNDLSFKAGDFVIGHQHVDGWWHGEHSSMTDNNGNLLSGEFPDNYVEYASLDASDEEYDDELSDIEEGDEEDDEDFGTLVKAEFPNDEKHPPDAKSGIDIKKTNTLLPGIAVSNDVSSRRAVRISAAVPVAAEPEQAAIKEREMILRKKRQEDRCNARIQARIQEERANRAYAVEEARLSEIENSMLRSKVAQQKLEKQRQSQRSKALRNTRRRRAKQTRREKLNKLTPESRKVFKRKRRELASNAIEDETKKIENERSAFQHNLNEARATIRRVESFVEKSTSQQTIAALKKQLESARIVEEDNVRNLANLSATKAERLTEIQDSAEFAALQFCEDLERDKGVSSLLTGQASTPSSTAASDVPRKKGNLRYAYAANRGVQISPKSCSADVEIDLSDAAKIAFDLHTANRVFTTGSRLRKLEIAIGRSRPNSISKGRGKLGSECSSRAALDLRAIPKARKTKKKGQFFFNL